MGDRSLTRIDNFLEFNKKTILKTAGKISREEALKKAHLEYSKYKKSLKLTEKTQSEVEYKADIKKK